MDPHAFLYSNGQMKDLGTLGSSPSYTLGMNNAGQVVGFAGLHAFLYSNGQMIDLDGSSNVVSVAESINDSGEVTGYMSIGPGNSLTHAFIYTNGQMIDLNNLIDPGLGITLSDAVAINDSGQIVARASGAGSGTVLLTPVPEPATWALVAAGLIAILP